MLDVAIYNISVNFVRNYTCSAELIFAVVLSGSICRLVIETVVESKKYVIDIYLMDNGCFDMKSYMFVCNVRNSIEYCGLNTYYCLI